MKVIYHNKCPIMWTTQWKSIQHSTSTDVTLYWKSIDGHVSISRYKFVLGLACYIQLLFWLLVQYIVYYIYNIQYIHHTYYITLYPTCESGNTVSHIIEKRDLNLPKAININRTLCTHFIENKNISIWFPALQQNEMREENSKRREMLNRVD